MHIVVCIKQIFDPEAAAALFRVDEEHNRAVFWQGTPQVISPFDEQALEAAFRIRDAVGTAKIAVITLGPDSARAAIKSALSMGADEAVLLSDPAFEGSDAHATAVALAAAIRKLGGVDLVLAGRQAADSDAGVVGLSLAEYLELPGISFAKDIRIEDRVVVVERVVGDGLEIVEANLPALVTVSHELGRPRKPSLRDTMKAARKPVIVWSAVDLGLAPEATGAAGARRVLERLYAPDNTVVCQFIESASPEQMAQNLARQLQAARLI